MRADSKDTFIEPETMSTNDKTAPERTAMQELIDWIQENEIRMPNAQRIVAKAIELRDTKEKDQRVSDHLTGFAAQVYYNYGIDYHAALNEQFGINDE